MTLTNSTTQRRFTKKMMYNSCAGEWEWNSESRAGGLKVEQNPTSKNILLLDTLDTL